MSRLEELFKSLLSKLDNANNEHTTIRGTWEQFSPGFLIPMKVCSRMKTSIHLGPSYGVALYQGRPYNQGVEESFSSTTVVAFAYSTKTNSKFPCL